MLDISGEVFDDLTVLRATEERNSRSQVMWELLCKCGNTCTASATDLKRGRRGFCKPCRDEKSKLSPYKSLYGNYKRLAEQRGYDFKISLEDFISLTKGDCFYCGEPPMQWYKKKGAVYGIHYNGVDRYENSIGYLKENVRTCCKFCNSAKWDTSASDLTDWLDRVVERRKGKNVG